MAGEQIVNGSAYRVGSTGARVRFADGSERTLLPARLYQFPQSGTVLEGSLSVEEALTAPTKRRKSIFDKMLRFYTDKAG